MTVNELHHMLVQMQWTYNYCPWCKGYRGHEQLCALADAIKQLDILRMYGLGKEELWFEVDGEFLVKK